MKGMTKREAAQRMVREDFDSMPLEVFERAFIGENYEYYDRVTQLTLPTPGQWVNYPECGYIEKVNFENNTFTLEGNEEIYNLDEIEFDMDYPTWGTVWLTSMLNYKIEDRDFVSKLNEIGFIVYDTDFGVVLGINGGGYDFYEAHWIPLYDLMGYQWHDED